MTNIEYPDITSFPNFERLVPPAKSADLKYLQNEVLNDKDGRIIHTWRGNHLNDKERFELCKELNLPVEIREMVFDSWQDAAIHICNYELKNPNISDEYKKYLIGQSLLYRIQQREKNGNTGVKYSCANELAHELYISAGTVLKYGVFSSAMDAVINQSLEFGQKILMNSIRISHENVIELSRLKPEEIRSVAQSALRDNIDHISLQYIRSEVKWRYIMPQIASDGKRRDRRKQIEVCSPEIRKMPEYDPDSEVNSLCMTIDSWISSIQRVKNSENFERITTKASLRLMKKLSFLEHTINSTQESLVERTNE